MFLDDITISEPDAEALQAVTDSFGNLYARIEPEIELIIRRLGDEPTTQQVTAAIEEIRALLEEELDDFAGYLNTTLPSYEQDAIQLGLTESLAILGLAYFYAGVDAEPQTAPADVLGQMLAVNSPLYNRLQMYGAYHAQQIADALLETIKGNLSELTGAQGIAKIMQASALASANALADAMRLTRTALLYSYREATRLNYVANSDTVSGWQWLAELDDRVCMSCVVMHGTIHGLDETLNDHHNGRCAMIPIVGEPVLQPDAGIQWFESLSAEQQKARMGNGRYEAWKAGSFELPEISKVYNDDVYGEMRRETPLKELTKGG
jgi:hypothetical protein